MRKLIFGLIISFFILGCAGRRVKKNKSIFEAKKTTQIDSTVHDKGQINKEIEEVSKVNTKTTEIITGWRYTAPGNILNPIGPTWIRFGLDSIDISKLPAGAILETNSQHKTKETDSLGTIKSLEQEIKDLKTKLSKKESAIVKKQIVEKETEKESFTWTALIVGLLVGGFLAKYGIPAIFKGIKKLIKPV